MREITQAELLSLWEAGRGLAPLDRAVLTAGMASRGTEGNAADWPLGKRNRVLAEFHRAMFGNVMRGFTRCISCSEQLEFEFNLEAISEAGREPGEQYVRVGKWTFRLPTSRVLALASQRTSESDATACLLSECLTGADPTEADWCAADVAEIETQLAAADPLAEIMLHFDCPACGASFDESLDVAAFVWAAIDALAHSTLREIHALASAYGWTESQILALSPTRRATYLEMVLA
jgi:hypothetical protein